MMGEVGSFFFFVCLLLQVVFSFLFYQEVEGAQHDYGDALNKSILFFEGQRSGRLPANQRLTWRKDSALQDGHLEGVDLVGGYYDAGDNVKFGFPMAFSTTMLAWSVVEFGRLMGPQELGHAKAALKWGTEYLLKATRFPNRVFVQVGEPYADHNCWQRPEDMGTPRTIYSVDKHRPGSEVAAETAAALAAASIVFRSSDPDYSRCLLDRALKVFHFANTYRGSYSHSLGHSVCPFYCDFSGYMDELLWASTWIHKASGNRYYRNYTVVNKDSIDQCSEFGWDDKHAGINILISKQVLLGKDYNHPRLAFKLNADKFICSVLPESPTRSVTYSPGGLLFKPGGSNMQHPTALSFLLLVYARYLSHAQQVVNCGNVVATPARLKQIAKSQVDYILGSNPMKMSYMVGYGDKFPQRIHHRASSLPSLDEHPDPIGCKDGTPYFLTKKPNPNLLIGAVVGGPDITDVYPDSRSLFVESEPTTYINAPLLGLLAYFNANPTH